MQAIYFLLDFAFDALLMILILRLWMQVVRADFYNPLSQFIVKVSNPLVVPFRKVIPGFGGIDVATVVLAYVIATFKFILIPLLSGAEINVVIALFLGGLYIIKEAGFLLFIIMLVMALMSWVVQGYNPTQAIFQQLTDPVLRPIRNVLPAIGGLDLSILVAFLILNVANLLLSDWLPYWAIL